MNNRMTSENIGYSDTGEVERTLTATVNVYYDLHLPETLPAPLLIALHGYGASKRQMMRQARQMAPETFAIASLQGFHQHLKDPKEPGGPLRFGFGWLTNFRPEESVVMHHRTLLELIKTLITESIADKERIFLLGFSQSCALNYRFTFTHPESLCQTSHAAIFHLAGLQDEFYPPDRVSDYAERLRFRAADVEFKSYDAGHEITAEMREDVRRWLMTYANATGDCL